MWSISRKKREPQRLPVCRSTKVQQPRSRRQTSRLTSAGIDLPDFGAGGRLTDPAPLAVRPGIEPRAITRGFAVEVRPADPVQSELCSGIELPAAARGCAAEVRSANPAPPVLGSEVELSAATRDFGAEVSSVATAPSALLARSARGATHFGAEVPLPAGGPRRLLVEASPEQPPAGKTAGEVPTSVDLVDRFGADGDVVADFSARRGFSAAAATRSAVSRPAVSAAHSSPAGSDFLRFRRGGRLGS